MIPSVNEVDSEDGNKTIKDDVKEASLF